MLLSTAVGLFLGFWSILYLVDYYFRAKSIQQYVNFVEKTGIVVTPFQVRWYTSRFQSVISSSFILKHQTLRNLLSCWFSTGVGVTIVTMFLMIAFLSQTLWIELKPFAKWLVPQQKQDIGETTFTSTPVASGDSSSNGGLIPVIPGVNVPVEQVPVLLLVLVMAGVFHELGHALAAMVENVGVNGFGVFLLAIYPGAFTEIENDSLDSVGLFRKLKIYCGGIWHNFTLALLGMAILFSLPYTMSFGYLVNKGVVVTGIEPHSGINGPAGLRAGSVVYGINYCKVYNEDTWYSCLNKVAKTNYGYCVPKQEVLANKSERIQNFNGEFHCCGANSTQTHLCFYYKTLNDSKLINLFEYSCLPARYVTDHYVCNYSLPCGPRTTCVYPALFNSTKLLRFFIANQSKPVLFVGFPSEVVNQVYMSSFVPKNRIFPVWIPDGLELFCKYLITFSLALAFLNSVPCYSLDGQFVTGVLCEIASLGHRKWTRRKKVIVFKGVMWFGTLLLVSNVVLALWKFVKVRYL